MPSQMVVVHRVMTKGAIFRNSTPKALAVPMASPINRHTSSPNGPLASLPCIADMQKMFTIMTVAPTDRSMPPTRITAA